jgi:hypothetical protein
MLGGGLIDSPYLVAYKAPHIVYQFKHFPIFYYAVPEAEYPRYQRVLQAFDGNLNLANERLQITFQADAERSYQEWRKKQTKNKT